jgi:hypothetical protein
MRNEDFLDLEIQEPDMNIYEVNDEDNNNRSFPEKVVRKFIFDHFPTITGRFSAWAFGNCDFIVP